MFWGERGEDLGRRNGKKRKEKDEQERSYRRLFFFVVMNLGWEGEGGVFWKEEGLR